MIGLLLEASEPFPAFVVDRAYDVVLANAAAGRFFSRLLEPADLAAMGRLNLMRAAFHPRGLQRFVLNWAAEIHGFACLMSAATADAAGAAMLVPAAQL